jgi:hypothetical protein
MPPLGTTIDPGHGLTLVDATRCGFSFVRLILRWHQDPTPLLRECLEAHVPVLALYTGESRAPGFDDRTSAIMWLGWLWRVGLLPVIRWLQVGNEPDLVGESSWTMSHDEFNGLINAVAPVFREHCRIIGGGLASGAPNWLAGVDQQYLDIVAIHPYGQKPNEDPIWTSALQEWANEVTWFLSLYREYTTLPLAVTEYGGRSNELGELTRRYVTEMSQALLGMVGIGELVLACQFCCSELMVPTFGCLDASGRLTPTGRGVRSLT